MKKNTLVSRILQVEFLKNFVAEAICEYNAQWRPDSEKIYHDTGRKMTVLVLVQYLLLIALVNCRSFREAELLGVEYGLAKVDFTTLAKKAQDVPCEIVQRVFCKVVATYSRKIRRKCDKRFQGMLQILDSTRITAYETKWSWAPFLRESSGVKFHVLYYPEMDCAVKIETSKIGEGDTAHMITFQNPERILIADRGYMNLENFAKLTQAGQKFVIRMRNTVKIYTVLVQKKKFTGTLCNFLHRVKTNLFLPIRCPLHKINSVLMA